MKIVGAVRAADGDQRVKTLGRGQRWNPRRDRCLIFLPVQSITSVAVYLLGKIAWKIRL